ncbi:unnamed protein product [Boreogadus saida]
MHLTLLQFPASRPSRWELSGDWGESSPCPGLTLLPRAPVERQRHCTVVVYPAWRPRQCDGSCYSLTPLFGRRMSAALAQQHLGEGQTPQ